MLYKYDKNTREFKGEFPSNPDGHIPDLFTDVEPMDFIEGKARVFNIEANVWESVTDNRLIAWYKKADGVKVKWNEIYTPNALYGYIDIEPTQNNPIWDEESEQWREKTEEEQYQDKVDGVLYPTIKLLGTYWGYDALSQWIVQQAENQAVNYSRKTILKDALGNWHKLTRRQSNSLQTAMFNKYLEGEGFVK